MHRKSVVCSSNGSVSLKSLKVPDARSESDCLIEIQCAALNPLDFAMSNGYGSNVLEKLRGTEFVLGQEFSGICVEAGANVFDIKEGDEVWGAVDPWSKCGTLSEYVRVNEVDIARKPQVLSHSLSAALPFAIMTVWRSVIEKARKRRSNNALILGKGNLGTCIHALLQEFVPECVMEMRGREGYDGPEKFDIVVDCSSSIGKPLVMEDFVSAGGFCVTFNGPWLPLTTEHGVIKGTLDAGAKLLEQKSQHWINHGSSYDWSVMSAGGNNILREISKRMDNGGLQPFLNREVVEVEGLERAAESWENLQQSKGKKVVIVKH